MSELKPTRLGGGWRTSGHQWRRSVRCRAKDAAFNRDVELLAQRYVQVLREWLEPAQFQTVLRTRGGSEHDYCDANMAVDQAFREVFHREPVISDETPYYCWQWLVAVGRLDLAQPHDLALWNAACERANQLMLKIAEGGA